MALGISIRWSAFLKSLGVLGAVVATGCSSSSSGAGGGAPMTQEDAAVTFPATDSNSSCQATITQGGLKGKAAGTTCEYLGIPYGAPPTGALRFMPPQPAASWTTTRDATAFGPSCLQAGSALGAVGTTSEDCLSVNVYTPQAAPSHPLPVMVFIYGGAFTSGSSSLYDGAPMSEKGPVVVVSLNYRLGALGFLALPQIDSARPGAPSGSDGIRDQQLALKWVKDNVATFHGDATNVTVFGESAGSASTCIHLVSPGSQGLANRYIMESGACVGKAAELDTQAQSYQTGQELASSFCLPGTDAGASSDGSPGTDAGASSDGSAASDASPPDEAGVTSQPLPADVLTCLQAADPMQLMTWVPPASAPQTGVGALLGNLLGPPFNPTVEGPGGVLPDLPSNLIAKGSYNKDAAILAGTNKNEWGLFVDLATSPLLGGSSSSPLNVTTAAQLDQGIEKIYGAAAAQVEAQYPATDATAPQVFIDLVTDYAFRCPTRALARATLAQGTKTYYLYSYEIGPAWHSFELVPLFNVTALTALGATNPSKAFTSEMLGYWTQFATTGDPNGPGDAGAPAWPAYDATGDQYLQLLDPTPMASAHLRQAQCDFWDTFTAATSM
jgi:para-nitrobenzyl esterase